MSLCEQICDFASRIAVFGISKRVIVLAENLIIWQARVTRMQTAIHILGFWAVAFVTLCVALLLLNIFYNLINFDLDLRSLGQEALIAAIASLVEGVGIWAVLTLIPSAMGGRALVVPALIVGLIYKISHLEDWNRYDVLALLLFQCAIGCIGAALLLGHFGTAFTILVIFIAVLAGVAIIAKSFE